MWKNVVDPDRPQMAIRYMCFARWMPYYRHTLRIWNNVWFPNGTM